MKRKEYYAYKKHVMEQYQKAIEKATRQKDEALAGLEALWRVYHPSTGESPTASNTVPGMAQPVAPASSGYGSLAKAIMAVLDKVPTPFTCKDVIAELERTSPGILATVRRSSISGRLYRLRRDEVIEEVEQGKGSAPTKYRRVVPKESGTDDPVKVATG